jgi:hypothetical protein
VHHEATTGDDSSSGDDSSASTCPTPADVSTWTPPAYKHAKSSLTACNAADLTGYDTACLAAGHTSAGCTAFQTAHAACTSCLNSKSTDSTWGAIVAWAGVININLAGCLELTDPNSAQCAQAVEVGDECLHQACDAVCPVKDQASFTQWQACQQAAAQQGCGTYEQAAACLQTDDAAAASVCNPSSGTSFDQLFLSVAPIFCGGGAPGDGGGGDGASEAATDAPPG